MSWQLALIDVIRAALTAKSCEYDILAAENQKDLSIAKDLLARFPFFHSVRRHSIWLLACQQRVYEVLRHNGFA